MLGARAVEVLAADGTQSRAVVLAEERGRKRQHQGIARPGAEVEDAVLHVRGLEVVGATGLRDLERVHGEHRRRRLEAAHAWSDERGLEAQSQREPPPGGPRDVDSYWDKLGSHGVALASEHERLYRDAEIEAPGLSRAETQPPKIK
jgi:hypothetical protein